MSTPINMMRFCAIPRGFFFIIASVLPVSMRLNMGAGRGAITENVGKDFSLGGVQ